jgi:hypothetical protein
MNSLEKGEANNVSSMKKGGKTARKKKKKEKKNSAADTNHHYFSIGVGVHRCRTSAIEAGFHCTCSTLQVISTFSCTPTSCTSCTRDGTCGRADARVDERCGSNSKCACMEINCAGPGSSSLAYAGTWRVQCGQKRAMHSIHVEIQIKRLAVVRKIRIKRSKQHTKR